MTGHLTRILATGVLATSLTGGIAAPSQAVPLPVASVQEIAGAAPTEQVRWWGGGWGWRRSYWGGGWGWRRPYYGGGALAAGLIGGLALGTLAASTSYYGYGYPYYGYGYAPAYYAYPTYYTYPEYYRPYRRVYYGGYYRPLYRRAYWRPAYYRPLYRRAYWR